MGKIRVNQLSKELGMSNKDILAKLKELGFSSIKTHSSSVDEDDARRALKSGKATTRHSAAPSATKAEAAVEEPKQRRRTVLRRRSKPQEPEIEAPQLAEAEAPQINAEPVEPNKLDKLDEAPSPIAAATVAATVSVESESPVHVEQERPASESPEVVLAQEDPEQKAVVATVPETEAVRTEPEAQPESLATAEIAQKGEAQAAPQTLPEPVAAAAHKTAPGANENPAAGKQAATSKVSKVVRVIDAEAIKARLAAEGKRFAPRRPNGGGGRPGGRLGGGRPGGGLPHVREVRVVQDQFGRGPTMVDVDRAGGGGAGPRRGGRKGSQSGAPDRREMLERRAGGRDMWRMPGKKRKATRKGQKTEITQKAAHKRVIEVPGTISVGDLAKQMAIKAGEVLRQLMSMGMMVTINQTIDYDTAAIIAAEFEYEAKNVAFEEDTLLLVEEDKPEALKSRWPVVTVMGHVDHGKTSLLDAIRASNVVDGEAGGITQHIGAYTVKTEKGVVTFLDTPGHAAFTAMRARGATITDIVVLVVAADDGVMPQTIEAIHHSQSAGVPIIVAVNKIDKPDADPNRVMQALTEYNLLSEAWGGETIFCNVSAKEGTGVPEVLEAILLQSEVMELKANPDKAAHGTIVEAQLDKGRGPVATVLIKEGTLKAGDAIVSGDFFGRVRAIYNDRGDLIEEATPSMPVQVLGLGGVPNAGDVFDVVSDEKTAKTIAEHRAQKTREKELAQSAKVSLENFMQHAKADEALELKLIVKADVQGSVEAVRDALSRLSNKQVKVIIVHHAVGAITESDINLASASDAVIIGFGVRPETKALQLAEQQHIDVRMYNIIYEAVDGVRAAMEGRLPTTTIEKYLGRAEVRQTFVLPKVGMIAGCYVIDGKLLRNANVRLLRDSVVLHDGKLSSLKRFKDDAREVVQGYECGAGFENYHDLKEGDLIEAYELHEIATKLEDVGNIDPDTSKESTQPNA